VFLEVSHFLAVRPNSVQKTAALPDSGGSAAARKRDFSGFGREGHACRHWLAMHTSAMSVLEETRQANGAG
jgi:hypothetical protein